jgi:hypothetical protein
MPQIDFSVGNTREMIRNLRAAADELEGIHADNWHDTVIYSYVYDSIVYINVTRKPKTLHMDTIVLDENDPERIRQDEEKAKINGQ